MSKDDDGHAFTLEREAATAMRAYMARVDGGEAAIQSGDTLASFLRDTWLPSRVSDVRASTWASCSDALEGRVIPRIGALKLRVITARHIVDLYADLLANGARDPRKAKGRSALTVWYTGMILTRALDDAVRPSGCLGQTLTSTSGRLRR